jgi:predicted NBD/HSP70 family sugar kinase
LENGDLTADLKRDRIDRFQRGSNQSGLRAYNERLVLSLVRRHGAMSKTDIAKMTGLSAQTISVIMRELEAEGLLKKGAPVRGKVGQPSIPMSLAPDGAYFLGLKLGRRSADMVLINFLGQIIGLIHQPYRYPTVDGIVGFASETIEKLLEKLTPAESKRVAGLGIAMPFQLWNWAETVGAPSGVMEQWRAHDVRSEIAARVNFPVFVQNDASSACSAELVFGQTSGPRDFIYFYLGYFVGGGVVLQGSLYTGQTGNACALGPMPIPAPDGTIRQLIDVASIAVLEKSLEDAGQDSSSLWDSPEAWNVDADLLENWIRQTARGLSMISIWPVSRHPSLPREVWATMLAPSVALASPCLKDSLLTKTPF